MTRNANSYGHFCVVARTLEQLGDRWTLLIVRDLLTGPKRFTDLMTRLATVTPTTLSRRLRELEDAGLVVADRQAGRREVYYALSDAGAELRSVVDALGAWGLQHAWRRPLPGEPLHAEHLLGAVARAMNLGGRSAGPATWHFRLDEEDYLLTNDGSDWTLRTGPPTGPVDVTVRGTTSTLASLIFGGSPPGPGPEITGEAASVRRARRELAQLARVTKDQS
jgi:DNA-binding HxlR family transcriptional regulator